MEQTGLEPATFYVQSKYSTNWTTAPYIHDSREIWTPDILIMIQSLYQLSYAVYLNQIQISLAGFEPTTFWAEIKYSSNWATETYELQGLELNQRPSGHEPDELTTAPPYTMKKRRMGLEPTQPAWKASALPLDDLRKILKIRKYWIWTNNLLCVRQMLYR